MNIKVHTHVWCNAIIIVDIYAGVRASKICIHKLFFLLTINIYDRVGPVKNDFLSIFIRLFS